MQAVSLALFVCALRVHPCCLKAMFLANHPHERQSHSSENCCMANFHLRSHHHMMHIWDAHVIGGRPISMSKEGCGMDAKDSTSSGFFGL